MKIEISNFGVVNGCKVQLFKLSNNNGVVIKLTNYGGIVASIETPDKNKKSKNIVLGFDDLESYLSSNYLKNYPYFGCLIGRVGNRIANSQFELNGKKYSVSKNKGEDHLHGGFVGFDRVIWKAKPFQNKESVGVELQYLSVEGEEGYPGNLYVKVIYSLTNKNEFVIEYFAETDIETPVNLTQHTYFNLGNESTIDNHLLQLSSNEYNELDAEMIPTGQLLPVNNSPYDFRDQKRIGNGFGLLEKGYDVNYSLNNAKGSFIKAGELYDQDSGRLLEVFTTEVGIQLYTGAYIPEIEINGVKKFGSFSGVALETQHFPDSVNHKHFPNTILKPNDNYYQKTIYKFSILEY